MLMKERSTVVPTRVLSDDLKVFRTLFGYISSLSFFVFSLSSLAPGPDTVLGLVGAELRHLRQAEPYGVQERHRPGDAHVPDQMHQK